MNRKDLYHSFNEVDDEILERSESAPQRKTKPAWPKWAAVAACLCLVIIGAVALPMLKQNPGNDTKDPNSGDITEAPNSSVYPYNDTKVLDYIGMPLNNLQTEHGTVIFNEITDIEAYRQYNTAYTTQGDSYYSTRTTAYNLLTGYPGSGEDILHFVVFEEDGSIENCLHYEEFLLYKERTPLAAELVMQVFEKNHATSVYAYYNGSVDASGISFNPETNCVATVVVGKDLAAIDDRFNSILPLLQETLGTENSSHLAEQEISVYYFYQTRRFRDEETEEAYQYYAYFERDGLQYLYQFSSNWSLPGQGVSAIHNPPSTLHYVKTQEECRKLFLDYLLTLVNAKE